MYRKWSKYVSKYVYVYIYIYMTIKELPCVWSTTPVNAEEEHNATIITLVRYGYRTVAHVCSLMGRRVHLTSTSGCEWRRSGHYEPIFAPRSSGTPTHFTRAMLPTTFRYSTPTSSTHFRTYSTIFIQLLYIASFLTFLPGTQPLYLSVAARAAQLDYYRLSTLWHSIWSSLWYSQWWIIWDPAHQDRSYWVSGGRMVCSTLQAIFTPSVRLRTVVYINLPALSHPSAVKSSARITRNSSTFVNSVYSSLSTRRFCSPGTA